MHVILCLQHIHKHKMTDFQGETDRFTISSVDSKIMSLSN